VDDKSSDKTVSVVESFEKKLSDKLILIKHIENIGVGGAIKSGYKKALELDIDIIVVMAGDAQMNPDYLPNLLDPIIEAGIDYTKGNRLEHFEKMKMPKVRRKGNSILTLLTKISSGYWTIIDPQN
jgi:glycosyltransferase involved in cell wall biosynthesis